MKNGHKSHSKPYTAGLSSIVPPVLLIKKIITLKKFGQ